MGTTHKKLKFEGPSVQKQSGNKRTDRRTGASDRFIFPANAVGNKDYRYQLKTESVQSRRIILHAFAQAAGACRDNDSLVTQRNGNSVGTASSRIIRTRADCRGQFTVGVSDTAELITLRCDMIHICTRKKIS